MKTNTKLALEKAGWHPGRKKNIKNWENMLLSEGFIIFPVVKEFLIEFGGLFIEFESKFVKHENENFHFHVSKAIDEVDSEWILKDYSDSVNTKLCIIGQAFRNNMVLMMDNLGNVYAGFDELLIFVGNSGINAIDRLCNVKEFKEIPLVQ